MLYNVEIHAQTKLKLQNLHKGVIAEEGGSRVCIYLFLKMYLFLLERVRKILLLLVHFPKGCNDQS